MGLIIHFCSFQFGLEVRIALVSKQQLYIIVTFIYLASPYEDSLHILLPLEHLHIKLGISFIVFLLCFVWEYQVQNFLFSDYFSNVNAHRVFSLDLVDEGLDGLLIFSASDGHP